MDQTANKLCCVLAKEFRKTIHKLQNFNKIAFCKKICVQSFVWNWSKLIGRFRNCRRFARVVCLLFLFHCHTLELVVRLDSFGVEVELPNTWKPPKPDGTFWRDPGAWLCRMKVVARKVHSGCSAVTIRVDFLASGFELCQSDTLMTSCSFECSLACEALHSTNHGVKWFSHRRLVVNRSQIDISTKLSELSRFAEKENSWTTKHHCFCFTLSDSSENQLPFSSQGFSVAASEGASVPREQETGFANMKTCDEPSACPDEDVGSVSEKTPGAACEMRSVENLSTGGVLEEEDHENEDPEETSDHQERSNRSVSLDPSFYDDSDSANSSGWTPVSSKRTHKTPRTPELKPVDEDFIDNGAKRTSTQTPSSDDESDDEALDLQLPASQDTQSQEPPLGNFTQAPASTPSLPSDEEDDLSDVGSPVFRPTTRRAASEKCEASNEVDSSEEDDDTPSGTSGDYVLRPADSLECIPELPEDGEEISNDSRKLVTEARKVLTNALDEARQERVGGDLFMNSEGEIFSPEESRRELSVIYEEEDEGPVFEVATEVGDAALEMVSSETHAHIIETPADAAPHSATRSVVEMSISRSVSEVTEENLEKFGGVDETESCSTAVESGEAEALCSERSVCSTSESRTVEEVVCAEMVSEVCTAEQQQTCQAKFEIKETASVKTQAEYSHPVVLAAEAIDIPTETSLLENTNAENFTSEVVRMEVESVSLELVEKSGPPASVVSEETLKTCPDVVISMNERDPCKAVIESTENCTETSKPTVELATVSRGCEETMCFAEENDTVRPADEHQAASETVTPNFRHGDSSNRFSTRASQQVSDAEADEVFIDLTDDADDESANATTECQTGTSEQEASHRQVEFAGEIVETGTTGEKVKTEQNDTTYETSVEERCPDSCLDKSTCTTETVLCGEVITCESDDEVTTKTEENDTKVASAGELENPLLQGHQSSRAVQLSSETVQNCSNTASVQAADDALESEQAAGAVCSSDCAARPEVSSSQSRAAEVVTENTEEDTVIISDTEDEEADEDEQVQDFRQAADSSRLMVKSPLTVTDEPIAESTGVLHQYIFPRTGVETVEPGDVVDGKMLNESVEGTLSPQQVEPSHAVDVGMMDTTPVEQVAAISKEANATTRSDPSTVQECKVSESVSGATVETPPVDMPETETNLVRQGEEPGAVVHASELRTADQAETSATENVLPQSEEACLQYLSEQESNAATRHMDQSPVLNARVRGDVSEMVTGECAVSNTVQDSLQRIPDTEVVEAKEASPVPPWLKLARCNSGSERVHAAQKAVTEEKDLETLPDVDDTKATVSLVTAPWVVKRRESSSQQCDNSHEAVTADKHTETVEVVPGQTMAEQHASGAERNSFRETTQEMSVGQVVQTADSDQRDLHTLADAPQEVLAELDASPSFTPSVDVERSISCVSSGEQVVSDTQGQVGVAGCPDVEEASVSEVDGERTNSDASALPAVEKLVSEVLRREETDAVTPVDSVDVNKAVSVVGNEASQTPLVSSPPATSVPEQTTGSHGTVSSLLVQEAVNVNTSLCEQHATSQAVMVEPSAQVCEVVEKISPQKTSPLKAAAEAQEEFTDTFTEAEAAEHWSDALTAAEASRVFVGDDSVVVKEASRLSSSFTADEQADAQAENILSEGHAEHGELTADPDSSIEETPEKRIHIDREESFSQADAKDASPTPAKRRRILSSDAEPILSEALLTDSAGGPEGGRRSVDWETDPLVKGGSQSGTTAPGSTEFGTTDPETSELNRTGDSESESLELELDMTDGSQAEATCDVRAEADETVLQNNCEAETGVIRGADEIQVSTQEAGGTTPEVSEKLPDVQTVPSEHVLVTKPRVSGTEESTYNLRVASTPRPGAEEPGLSSQQLIANVVGLQSEETSPAAEFDEPILDSQVLKQDSADDRNDERTISSENKEARRRLGFDDESKLQEKCEVSESVQPDVDEPILCSQLLRQDTLETGETSSTVSWLNKDSKRCMSTDSDGPILDSQLLRGNSANTTEADVMSVKRTTSLDSDEPIFSSQLLRGDSGVTSDGQNREQEVSTTTQDQLDLTLTEEELNLGLPDSDAPASQSVQSSPGSSAGDSDKENVAPSGGGVSRAAVLAALERLNEDDDAETVSCVEILSSDEEEDKSPPTALWLRKKRSSDELNETGEMELDGSWEHPLEIDESDTEDDTSAETQESKHSEDESPKAKKIKTEHFDEDDDDDDEPILCTQQLHGPSPQTKVEGDSRRESEDHSRSSSRRQSQEKRTRQDSGDAEPPTKKSRVHVENQSSLEEPVSSTLEVQSEAAAESQEPGKASSSGVGGGRRMSDSDVIICSDDDSPLNLSVKDNPTQGETQPRAPNQTSSTVHVDKDPIPPASERQQTARNSSGDENEMPTLVLQHTAETVLTTDEDSATCPSLMEEATSVGDMEAKGTKLQTPIAEKDPIVNSKGMPVLLAEDLNAPTSSPGYEERESDIPVLTAERDQQLLHEAEVHSLPMEQVEWTEPCDLDSCEPETERSGAFTTEKSEPQAGRESGPVEQTRGAAESKGVASIDSQTEHGKNEETQMTEKVCNNKVNGLDTEDSIVISSDDEVNAERVSKPQETISQNSVRIEVRTAQECVVSQEQETVEFMAVPQEGSSVDPVPVTENRQREGKAVKIEVAPVATTSSSSSGISITSASDDSSGYENGHLSKPSSCSTDETGSDDHTISRSVDADNAVGKEATSGQREDDDTVADHDPAGQFDDADSDKDGASAADYQQRTPCPKVKPFQRARSCRSVPYKKPPRPGLTPPPRGPACSTPRRVQDTPPPLGVSTPPARVLVSPSSGPGVGFTASPRGVRGSSASRTAAAFPTRRTLIARSCAEARTMRDAFSETRSPGGAARATQSPVGCVGNPSSQPTSSQCSLNDSSDTSVTTESSPEKCGQQNPRPSPLQPNERAKCSQIVEADSSEPSGQ